jgi:hypothetical protein
VRTHALTVLFVSLLLAAMIWMMPAIHGPRLPASAQFSYYLPIVFRTWPPVPGQCYLWPIDNGDGDGNYTVSWGAERAEEFELQERWEAQDWFIAYLGADTSVNLSNRPAGWYAYRCVARNSWGEGVWSNEVGVQVQGTEPGSISRPSCSSVNAGGQAVAKVINDCPYVLTLDFTGPQPATMQLPKCNVCKVYSLIGPFYCPTSGRPVQEQYLAPGDYRVYVTVDNPSIRPYLGQWTLYGDCRYSTCFYIVTSWSAEVGLQRQLVPGRCD